MTRSASHGRVKSSHCQQPRARFGRHYWQPTQSVWPRQRTMSELLLSAIIISALSRLVNWTVQTGTEVTSVCLRSRHDCDFLANVNSCSCSLFVVVRPSVCLSVVCLSVCLSVTFVHPTQPIEIFGNVSAPCNTLVTWQHPCKILRRSSQGNPSVGGLNQRVVEKFSDSGPLRGYISETVQDRS